MAGIAARPGFMEFPREPRRRLCQREQGYEVIERHIRQGAAESATRGQSQTATIGQGRRAAKLTKKAHTQNELQGTITRVFRSLSELMPLIVDLVNSPGAAGLAQNLFFNNPLAQPPNHNRSHDAAARVDIELSSPRPATVSIELHPDAERRALAIANLHDLRGRTLALDAIAFTPAKGRKRARLRVRVPDGQPPGIFSGVLLDRSTSEPRGVLTVRVSR